MNQSKRKQAAERIQKAHDAFESWAGKYSENSPHKAHNNRAELLTLLADAERENEKLRGYTVHPTECHIHYEWEDKGYCDCGLDELLKQEPPHDN